MCKIEHFLVQWIGQDGQIGWLPHSLDLIPIDFFLGRFAKDVLHKTTLQ
jgi:hypothetical protein